MKTKNIANSTTDLMENGSNSIDEFVDNTVSNHRIDELIDTIWLHSSSINVIETIGMYLWDLYDNDRYNELVGALTILYLAFDVGLPDVVNIIIKSDSVELYKTFFYEFLTDYEELKYEYCCYGDNGNE